MYFAKYSIEKCYLLYEIARSHLSQSRFEECCSVARKSIEGLYSIIYNFDLNLVGRTFSLCRNEELQ